MWGQFAGFVRLEVHLIRFVSDGIAPDEIQETQVFRILILGRLQRKRCHTGLIGKIHHLCEKIGRKWLTLTSGSHTPLSSKAIEPEASSLKKCPMDLSAEDFVRLGLDLGRGGLPMPPLWLLPPPHSGNPYSNLLEGSVWHFRNYWVTLPLKSSKHCTTKCLPSNSDTFASSLKTTPVPACEK